LKNINFGDVFSGWSMVGGILLGKKNWLKNPIVWLWIPACRLPVGRQGRQVVKEGDEILIYEHYSGELIFGYNKNKEVDKEAYREFEEVWEETREVVIFAVFI